MQRFLRSAVSRSCDHMRLFSTSQLTGNDFRTVDVMLGMTGIGFPNSTHIGSAELACHCLGEDRNTAHAYMFYDTEGVLQTIDFENNHKLRLVMAAEHLREQQPNLYAYANSICHYDGGDSAEITKSYMEIVDDFGETTAVYPSLAAEYGNELIARTQDLHRRGAIDLHGEDVRDAMRSLQNRSFRPYGRMDS